MTLKWNKVTKKIEKLDPPKSSGVAYTKLSAKGRAAISKAAKAMWAKKKSRQEKKNRSSVAFAKLNVPEGTASSGQGVQANIYLTPDMFIKKSVNHPQHYGGDTTYEVIKVLEAWGLSNSFCLGNTVKYIARYNNKGTALEDLKKAAWYLNREIENMEKK